MGPRLDVGVPGWEGWYFEEDFLCTPEGNRFTPVCIRVCHFLRQSEHFRDVLRWRTQAGYFSQSVQAIGSCKARVRSPAYRDDLSADAAKAPHKNLFLSGAAKASRGGSG